MEALGIDTKNFLLSKLKTDYADQFTNLIDISSFNRHRKRLAEMIERVIGQRLEQLCNTMIVDSILVPFNIMVREGTFESFHANFETALAKEHSAMNRNWYIGHKLHVIIYDNGTIRQAIISKANFHNKNFLKELDHLPEQSHC